MGILDRLRRKQNTIKTSGKYGNNFVRTKKGNGMEYGEPFLRLRIKGAKSYVTGMLFDSNGKLLQVEQSKKPEIDTVRFELYQKKGGKIVPYELGRYTIKVQGDANPGHGATSYTDEFYIVPGGEVLGP